MHDKLRAVLLKAAALAGNLLEQPAAPPGAGLLEAVEQAKADWQTAREYFELVTDPDLIDFAIYNLEAAQRRYTYLLKQVRAQGAKVEVV